MRYKHLAFEQSKKGRISYISKRYNKANNKYLYLLFIFKFTSKFIPTSAFKWIDPQEFGLNIYIYIYIPEIFQRIMFSKELPELHDYPFAPDKTEI